MLATLYTNTIEKLEPAIITYNKAINISKNKPNKPELILEIIE